MNLERDVSAFEGVGPSAHPAGRRPAVVPPAQPAGSARAGGPRARPYERGTVCS
jgi:hypothetical protein